MILPERRYVFGQEPVAAGVLAAVQAGEASKAGDSRIESIVIGVVTGTLTWFVWRLLDNIFEKRAR